MPDLQEVVARAEQIIDMNTPGACYSQLGLFLVNLLLCCSITSFAEDHQKSKTGEMGERLCCFILEGT